MEKKKEEQKERPDQIFFEIQQEKVESEQKNQKNEWSFAKWIKIIIIFLVIASFVYLFFTGN